MNRAFGLPFAASIVGHGALLVLLVLLMTRFSPIPLPLPMPKRGIEVLIAPPTPPATPLIQAPPVAAQPAPAPPVVKTEPPPTPPVVKRQPPPPRHSAPLPREPSPAPITVAPPVIAPPPLPSPVPAAPAPAPVPAPAVSAAYRAALSAWLEGHKQYPEGARARGEEGQAVLRFRVDRSGRVLGFSIARGTGHAELDAAVERMMRGAVLPPFPADMTSSDIEVSVTVRFALAR